LTAECSEQAVNRKITLNCIIKIGADAVGFINGGISCVNNVKMLALLKLF